MTSKMMSIIGDADPPILDPGVLCGPYFYGSGFSGEQSTWSGYWRSAFTGSIITELNQARSEGATTIYGLASGSQFYGARGLFVLADWEAQMDQMFNAHDLSSYIADGTLLANMLIDEPKAQNTWGGQVVPNDVLDWMAEYSKNYWPTLPALVRADADGLINEATTGGGPWPGGDFVWQYLDGTIDQYRSQEGEIGAWCDNIETYSDRQDLSFVFSLQAITGGDGSSGVKVQGRPQWAMSPTEISTYGTRMLQETDCGGLLIWRYFTSSDCSDCYAYWTTAEMQAAHANLRGLAASHAPQNLLRR